MKKAIILFVFISIFAFISCSDGPHTSGGGGTNEPVTPTPPETSIEITESLSTEKFAIEKTVLALNDTISQVLKRQETVNLKGQELGDLVVDEGSISIASSSKRATSDAKNLIVNIVKAHLKNQERKEIALTYESTVEMTEDNKISTIKTTKAEATVAGAKVENIDTSYVPLALTFSNNDKIKIIEKIVDHVATHIASWEGEEETTTIDGISVTIDLKLTGILPNKSGVIVFKSDFIDENWHKISITSNGITLDGWADVNSTEGIKENEYPAIKSDTERPFSDQEAVDIAADLYTYYMFGQSMSQGSFSEGENPHTSLNSDYKIIGTEDIQQKDVPIEKIALPLLSKKYLERGAAESLYAKIPLSIEENKTYDIEIDCDFSGLDFNSITLKAKTNNQSSIDGNFTEFKIDGIDYSYLRDDIYKSIIRIFYCFAPIQEGAMVIRFKTDFDKIDNSYLYTLDMDKLKTDGTTSQYSFSTKKDTPIKVTITEANKTGSFIFEEVSVFEENERPLIVSGSGNYEFRGSSFILKMNTFEIKGMGTITENELFNLGLIIEMMSYS